MATFYIQLQDKLLQISGDLTAENISKALGYVPVSPNVTNELSQRVDNITFDSLKDNPFLQDGSGELNIVDEAGNIIAKIDAEGIHSVDFIAGNHKLTDKIDSSALNGYAKESWVTAEITKAATEGKVDLTGYATEEWVENKNYLTEHQDISHLATKDELNDKDFYDIKNNPIVNGEKGNLVFVDESGNIGLKLDSDNNLIVKDVVASEHILSNKVDKVEGKQLSAEDFTTALKNKLQSLSNYDDTSITEAVNSLRTDFDTLVSGDTTTAIKTFNEIIAFLNGVEDTESLEGIIASIEQQIASIEIPSLDGYATESWVEDKKYLTEHQDISYLATKKEVGESIDNINFYTIKDNPIVDNNDGNLTFVDETGNIGLQFSNNAILVNDVITPEHTLSSKADKSFVEDNYYNKSTIDKKITDAVTGGQVSLDGFATEQWVNEQGFLKDHQDISHLATKTEINEINSTITDNEYVTANAFINIDNRITSLEEIDFNNFANKDEIPTVPTKTSELTNDSGFITINDVPVLEIPEEYVTDDELSQKGFLVGEETTEELDDVETNTYIKYVAQTLTDEQKNQVRENLGIPSVDYIISVFEELKTLINNNSASDAIAVLDKAILDMHKLQ